MFNLSLTESVIPACFKQITIVPVPKEAKVTCLNDYRPVALVSVAVKCFERLFMAHINTITPETLDPLQFNTSAMLVLNTVPPLGCVLSPLLYSLFTHCSASDRKAPQRVVHTAQYITGAQLPAIQDHYTRWCQRKTLKIVRLQPPKS